MSEDEAASVDTELEKYRIRYGLYKVVFGTAIVGLASVLVPGAVEFWQLRFENQRKAVEIQLAQVNQQQDYVKDFLQTALNQDIELRIRFADYFAHVSASPFKKDWIAYRDSLFKVRDPIRREIHERELEIRIAMVDPDPDIQTQALIAQLSRELEWRYREVGYVARDRSVVQSKNEELEPEPPRYKPTFPMPNVLGLTIAAAEKLVFTAGRISGATSARAVVVSRQSTAWPDGQIVRQLNSAGTMMRPYRDDVGGNYGEVAFNVVVSTGPPG